MFLSSIRVESAGQNSPQTNCRSSWLAVYMTLTLASCASPSSTPDKPDYLAPPPSTEIYFYPNKGQSTAQQDRDRYECYLWSRQQTGFDPSAAQLAPHQRVRVVPTVPPGHDTAAGAVTGAVIGAVVSPPNRSVEGAVVGAVAGAVAGAASDAARQEQVEREQIRHNRRATQRSARIEQQASSYRRAMSACLEGRGYAVQ